MRKYLHREVHNGMILKERFLKIRIIMKKVIFALSFFLYSHAVATVPVDKMVALCSPYPEISTADKPLEFNGTNNLARPKDSAFYKAEGDIITIYGRLMGSDCVPINDGKIYIWQNNSKGYAQYKTKSGAKAKWIDPNFIGTGIINSDNLGRFSFITVKPGSANKTTPYINIEIEHPKLKTFSSKIYFPLEGGDIYDNSKITDPSKIAKISAVPGARDANGKVTTYFIDITLRQKVAYKEY